MNNDRLWEYALGALSAEEALEVETEVANSPELAAELALTQEALTGVGGALTPIEPAAAVKERLMQSVSAG